MPIRDDMLNGFLITHGGFVFAVADTAFAIACNDTDLVTVAAGADVTFLATTTVGDTLTATALLRAQAGRSGIYDVQVTKQDGTVVAEFRGRSRRTNMPVPTDPK
jgi:acyl-CoA thioesterase